MYPRFYMTTGRYTFMKLKNRFEFDWMTFNTDSGKLSLEVGTVKTHFAQNITVFLSYESHILINETIWKTIEKLRYETA